MACNMRIKEGKELETASDEEVLAYSLEHPSSFEVLLDRYEGAFLRKARSIVGTQENAEDVVQEVFVKIYRNAEKFKYVEGASFKSWAYKILMNTSFTHYKKIKNNRDRTVVLEDDVYENIADEKMNSEDMLTKDYVYSILKQMPENLAKVLKMHVIDGLPQGEIAEKEGVSVGAIKTRVHRAKQAFKELSLHII